MMECALLKSRAVAQSKNFFAFFNRGYNNYYITIEIQTEKVLAIEKPT